jgi:hypothetical protein
MLTPLAVRYILDKEVVDRELVQLPGCLQKNQVGHQNRDDEICPSLPSRHLADIVSHEHRGCDSKDYRGFFEFGIVFHRWAGPCVRDMFDPVGKIGLEMLELTRVHKQIMRCTSLPKVSEHRRLSCFCEGVGNGPYVGKCFLSI